MQRQFFIPFLNNSCEHEFFKPRVKIFQAKIYFVNDGIF